MELFRISAEKYSSKLSSSGSANRWNKKGEFVIYTGSSRSLSTLELVVHRSAIKPAIAYKLMVISVSDSDELVKTIKTKDLPTDWRLFKAYPELQQIGSDWYSSQESLLLRVPSAVIPYEYNYVINVNHPDFKDNVKLIRQEDYFWDDRLLK